MKDMTLWVQKIRLADRLAKIVRGHSGNSVTQWQNAMIRCTQGTLGQPSILSRAWPDPEEIICGLK